MTTGEALPLPMWLEYGARPWDPCVWVERWEAWHMNDIPTMGRFQIGSTWMLFCCDGEPWRGRQRWWYAKCPDDVPEIFDDAELMTDWVDETMANASPVWSVIAEDYRISEHTAEKEEVR